MFSFITHYVKLPRRFAARITVVLFCLLLLFTGCSMGENETFFANNTLNGYLIGTWKSNYGDSYAINKDDHITYYSSGETIGHAGTIQYVTNFSHDSGVLIIKYDDDHKPVYYAGYDPNPPYGPLGPPLPLKGNFIGIYFKTLKPGVSLQMGGAYIAGGAEATTLEAAKTAFTLGNEGVYMGRYGTYAK